MGRAVGQPRGMDQLQAIEERFKALRRSGELDKALREWRVRTGTELGSFADVGALATYLRDPDAAPAPMKDSAFAAICVEAGRGEPSAVVMTLWLMLPTLVRLRHRLRSSVLGREDLEAELIAGVWEAIARVELHTINVPSRLRWGAYRRASAAVRAAEEWGERVQPLREERGGHAGFPVDGRDDRDAYDVLSEAVRAGVISSEEADLFRVSRTSVGTLRTVLGVSESGLRLRRGRAKRRLIEWLAAGRPPRSIGALPRPPWRLPEKSPVSPDTEAAATAALVEVPAPRAGPPTRGLGAHGREEVAPQGPTRGPVQDH